MKTHPCHKFIITPNTPPFLMLLTAALGRFRGSQYHGDNLGLSLRILYLCPWTHVPRCIPRSYSPVSSFMAPQFLAQNLCAWLHDLLRSSLRPNSQPEWEQPPPQATLTGEAKELEEEIEVRKEGLQRWVYSWLSLSAPVKCGKVATCRGTIP